jgi:hypothetical protein
MQHIAGCQVYPLHWVHAEAGKLVNFRRDSAPSAWNSRATLEAQPE